MVTYIVTGFLLGYVIATDQCGSLLKFDHQLKWGKRLTDHMVSTLKTNDLLKCTQSCVRQKVCHSINFDTKLKVCEVNNITVGNDEILEEVSGYLYSEYTSWPSQIDPDCYARPCTENQICIPGREVNAAFSHICLDLGATSTSIPSCNRDVCFVSPRSSSSTSTVSSKSVVTTTSVPKTSPVSSSLSDVDECELNTHQCDHICTNTIGSYTCSCHESSFTLMSDGKTCQRQTQTRICTTSQTQRVKYHVACGTWGWWRCSRYKIHVTYRYKVCQV